MKINKAIYIYAYKNSNLNILTTPISNYLLNTNYTLSDLDYYITTYNKDKSINKSDLNKLLYNIKRINELILIENIYPPKEELNEIIALCQKYNTKVITISKNGVIK